MERVNVIKDICQKLGLTQVQGSWIKTLGQHLGVAELPGGDDYEQRVFTAAVSNSEVVVPPAVINTKDHGSAFNSQTVGYNFTGNGVTLTNSISNVVRVDVPGLPYKTYSARISQSGADSAPTEDAVLYNDLGYNLVYEYAAGSPGLYWVHPSTGSFGTNPSKIVCISGGSQLTGDAQGNFQTINQNTDDIGGGFPANQNWIRIEAFEIPGSFSDNVLNGKFIEIRVYN